MTPRVAESAHDPDRIDSLEVTYNDFLLAGAKSWAANVFAA